jgi:phosphohistidine phosphatase
MDQATRNREAAMELYLVQHGEAKEKEQDLDRPLTERGRQDVGYVASVTARMGLAPASIWHSGKLRARQTALIFAELLEPIEETREHVGLAPKDDPRALADEIRALEGGLMIVGHLPHLGRLAGLLLVGDADREVVAFRNGGVVCLEHEHGGWRLVWILTPDIARKLEGRGPSSSCS